MVYEWGPFRTWFRDNLSVALACGKEKNESTDQFWGTQYLRGGVTKSEPAPPPPCL